MRYRIEICRDRVRGSEIHSEALKYTWQIWTRMRGAKGKMWGLTDQEHQRAHYKSLCLPLCELVRSAYTPHVLECERKQRQITHRKAEVESWALVVHQIGTIGPSVQIGGVNML